MSGLRERLADACKENNKRYGVYGLREDAALATFRAWLAENGLVVVPKSPSEDQFRAGSTFRFTVETHGYKDTAGIYEAMIAAAPDALKATDTAQDGGE